MAAFSLRFYLIIDDKREIMQFLSDFQTQFLPNASADVAKCYRVSRFQQITQSAQFATEMDHGDSSDKASRTKQTHNFRTCTQPHALKSSETKQNSRLWYGLSIMAQQQRIPQYLNAFGPYSKSRSISLAIARC